MNAKNITLAGSGMLIVGSFMPWGLIQSAFGSMTISGMEGDGIITIVIGGILLLGALTAKGKPGKMFSVVGAILSGISVITSFNVLSNMLKAVGSEGGVNASVGAGVYVIIIGSLVSVVGCVTKIPAEHIEEVSAGQEVPVVSEVTKTEE